MNKDQVTGRVREAQGRLLELTGRLLGNPRLQSQGRSTQSSGHVQAGYGDLKRDLKRSV